MLGRQASVSLPVLFCDCLKQCFGELKSLFVICAVFIGAVVFTTARPSNMNRVSGIGDWKFVASSDYFQLFTKLSEAQRAIVEDIPISNPAPKKHSTASFLDGYELSNWYPQIESCGARRSYYKLASPFPFHAKVWEVVALRQIILPFNPTGMGESGSGDTTSCIPPINRNSYASYFTVKYSTMLNFQSVECYKSPLEFLRGGNLGTSGISAFLRRVQCPLGNFSLTSGVQKKTERDQERQNSDDPNYRGNEKLHLPVKVKAVPFTLLFRWILGLSFIILGGACIFFGLLNLIGSDVDFRVSGLLFLNAILLITHGASVIGLDPLGIYAF